MASRKEFAKYFTKIKVRKANSITTLRKKEYTHTILIKYR